MARTRGANGRGRSRGKGSRAPDNREESKEEESKETRGDESLSKGGRGRGRGRSPRGKHSRASNSRVESSSEESKEMRRDESLSERGRGRMPMEEVEAEEKAVELLTTERSRRRRSQKKREVMSHSLNEVEAEEEIEAKATEHPFLTMQLSHKSQAIIDKELVDTMTVRHAFHFLEWDDRYEPYLKASGFYGVHQIQRVKVNDAFICALIERWRPETHTFHLSVGEMTVTLEDVAVLLGLPVDGKPVCGTTNMNWAEVIEKYLGVTPDVKCMANKSALSLTWLRTKFGSLDPEATDVQVQQYFRAYILCILGSFMLPNLTGDSVPCMYLILLCNLEEIKSYSWGSAILAKLYRMLCHGCRKNAMQIAGPIGLLQMWAWERFKFLSPVALNRVMLCGRRPEDVPPRVYYWSAKHEWQREKKGTVEDYRRLLDIMEDGDVRWTPYNNISIRSILPPTCNARYKCLLTTAPLIDFSTVETYHPDRVMRQFNKFQVIPPPARLTLPDIHKVNRQKYPINDWLEYHNKHIESWNKREETFVEETKAYDHQRHREYMEWYKGATIPTFVPYIGLSTDGATVGEWLGRARASTNELVAEAVQIGKDLGRKMQTNIDLVTMHETKNMLRFCRNVVDMVSDVFIFDNELKGEGISPFNWKKRKICLANAESSKATGEGAATQASQKMTTCRDSKVAKTNILKSAMQTRGRRKRSHGEGEGSKGEGQKRKELLCEGGGEYSLEILDVVKAKEKKVREGGRFMPKTKFDKWSHDKDQHREVIFKRPKDTAWSFSNSIFGDPYENEKKSRRISKYQYKYRLAVSDKVRDVLDKFAEADKTQKDEETVGFDYDETFFCNYKHLKEVLDNENISSPIMDIALYIMQSETPVPFDWFFFKTMNTQLLTKDYIRKKVIARSEPHLITPQFAQAKWFFVPYCVEYHWILLAVNLVEKEILWFNSMNNDEEYVGGSKHIFEWLKYFLAWRFDDITWLSVEINMMSYPKQNESKDCAVFVLQNIYNIISGAKMHSFNQKEIHKRRLCLLYKILTSEKNKIQTFKE